MLAGHGAARLGRLQLVGADDVRHLGEPALEQLLHLGARRELRVMVELDVRDDRDLRTQQLDRPVGLVTLDDEPAFAGARVSAQLGNLSAD